MFDEFTLQHGKTVSRRLFESKLNHITTGKLKCEKTGKLRWIFKNEIFKDFLGDDPNYTNNNKIDIPAIADPDNSAMMQID